MLAAFRSCAAWAGESCVRKRFSRSALFAAFGGFFCLVVAIGACASTAQAQETAVDLDPANSTITFTLGATLHTVHGTFKMKSGEIRFDAVTGKASGSIIVDATTGNTDNSSRDHKMHAEIIESAKYPEIVFSPSLLTPSPGHTLKETLQQQGAAEIQASGIFRLHGEDHEVTLTLDVRNEGDGRVEIASTFPIPYIQWGLKSPNTFILHVSDTVDLDIHASGKITSGARQTATFGSTRGTSSTATQ